MIIRGGTVVREAGVKKLDIAIAGGEIVEIIPEVSGDASETIDASRFHIFPGLIDPNVGFCEPGDSDSEGIASGSSALAAGGGTMFFDMPNGSAPAVLDGDSFDQKLAAAEAHSHTDFSLWGGLTPKNLDRMEELAARGVIGFKAYLCDSGSADFPPADDYTLYRGMVLAARLGRVVAVHAENNAITRGLTRDLTSRGLSGPTEYNHSRPVLAEVEAIRRAVDIADAVGCQLHICNVSSADGSWVAHGSANNGQVSYETCPHYALLSETDLTRLGPIAKCMPPLRSARDGELLRFVLLNGDVSFVASNHVPATPAMKEGHDFFKAAPGIAGVQSTLPAMLSIHPPLRLSSVAAYTSSNVATRFGIFGKGAITPGADADLALVDLASRYELTRDMLLDRNKHNPYVGRTFTGMVHRTIVRGKTVFLDGNIVSEPMGRLVKPA
jgi:allantoinase